MRVLLIQGVSTVSGGECVYPLGLARLAAVLRGKHELKGLDLNLSPFPWPGLIAALDEFAPQAVCLSFRNLDPLAGNLASFVPALKTTATIVRQHAPSARIIIGGSGFSLFAARLMAEAPELDLGLRGEAEQSLPLLLDSLDEPAAVPGAVYRQGGQVIASAAAHVQNPAALPAPDYSLFPLADYQARNQYVTSLGVESKRGCPHTCAYCLYPSLQGNAVRLLPPRMVVDHLEFLRHEHGVKAVHFTDPVVNQPAGHLRAICQEIVARGLDLAWTGFFREDALSEADLELWQRAGLSALYFSADGASEHALRLLNKGLSVGQIEQAARLAARSGAISVYHFLVNLPGESAATAGQTRRLVEGILSEHHRAGNPAAMVFNNLRPYPNAPLTERLLHERLMDHRIDLLYPLYFNPPPFDGLRHELAALALRPEHLGLAAPGRGEGAPCGC